MLFLLYHVGKTARKKLYTFSRFHFVLNIFSSVAQLNLQTGSFQVWAPTVLMEVQSERIQRRLEMLARTVLTQVV